VEVPVLSKSLPADDKTQEVITIGIAIAVVAWMALTIMAAPFDEEPAVTPQGSTIPSVSPRVVDYLCFPWRAFRSGLRASARALGFSKMRDLETINSELRLLAAVRWSIREHGGEPSSRQADELLD
jgi:hypothetical protein